MWARAEIANGLRQHLFVVLGFAEVGRRPGCFDFPHAALKGGNSKVMCVCVVVSINTMEFSLGE